MKKKLLKLLILLIFFSGGNSVRSNEKIVLPKKKPIVINEQKPKKIANYLVPLKKPTVQIKEDKPKEIKKLIVNGEIIPRSKPLVVTTEKSIRAKKSKSTYIISIKTDGYQWLEGSAYWESPTLSKPLTKENEKALKEHLEGKAKQRQGI